MDHIAYRNFVKNIESMIQQASRHIGAPLRTTVKVGPDEARALLSFSKGNRSEKGYAIEAFARDMARGAWGLTHQGFAFTVSGRFFDGHHRCKAIIASGCTISVEITFGLPEESVKNTDMGKTRSIADHLTFDGRPVSRREVAAIRHCMQLAERERSPKRTVSEVEEGLARHEAAFEALRELMGSKFATAFWGALMFAYPVNPHAVVQLAKECLDGEGVTGTAFTLREYLIRHSPKCSEDSSRLAQVTLYAARAFIEKRTIGKFSPANTESGKPDVQFTARWFHDRLHGEEAAE